MGRLPKCPLCGKRCKYMLAHTEILCTNTKCNYAIGSIAAHRAICAKVKGRKVVARTYARRTRGGLHVCTKTECELMADCKTMQKLGKCRRVLIVEARP